ncbi:MAG TPA: hypothetical protein VFT75_00640 [Nocardioidaceae bacterium]|nr:hypothetical protein [Nocardioidaceae bacterium]
MIQSQLFLMSEESVWKADMAARRERVSRMYPKRGRRRRVPALPVLHLPHRHRGRAVVVA